jgi:peptidyl-prolyl cis-trans isomerase SurA
MNTAYAQEQVIDEVVAVVGANYILASEVEEQYLQYRAQGDITEASTLRCRIFEDMLFQKLMLNQAELDSINISDDQINQTMDARFRYYIQQFGSQEKMEKYYKKSLLEIREDFRSKVKEQLMVEEVQQGLVKDVKVTPAEVRRMFNAIVPDSIPVIEEQYELGVIVKQPVITKEELDATRERLKGLRERILNGENFNALAVLYSEDPGSSRKGGEIGFVGRGQLYPEYEATAFYLRKARFLILLKPRLVIT